MSDIFKTIKGLKPVDPALLEPFRKEMEEKVIPALVEAERRRLWCPL